MSDLRDLLKAHFRWRGDFWDATSGADVTGWWRSAEILRQLGPALGALCLGAPTVVLGPVSRGTLVGSLVAAHLGVGLVELRKDPETLADSDTWLIRTSPPDYRDSHLSLGFRRSLISSEDRVLLVDDWIDTGAQASTARGLVEDAGATWLGAAVMVDALESASRRRDLGVRCLLRSRELE